MTACLSQNVSAQELVKRLKADFNAVGDGVANDSKAWADAINFFNGKKNGTLIIEKGTYLIGEQTVDTDINNNVRFANLKYPAVLRNATDIKIVGEADKKSGKPVSVLKYMDGLYYGYFNPQTRKDALVTNLDSEANLGVIINLNTGCNNIKIENLELDGNFDHQNYIPVPKGVKRGADVGHYGITSFGASGLVIENVFTHHFALDGIYIQTQREVLPEGKYHVIVRKCISDYNGRQGLSFTVGSSILMQDSEFKNTGKGRIRISPAANIDIENHDPSGEALRNITIDNCLVTGNFGGTGSINIAGKVENVVINNSVIDVGERKKGEHSGFSITSIFSPDENLLVKNSKIRGKLLLYSKDRGTQSNGKATFTNCEIIDSDLSEKIPEDQVFIDTHEDFEFKNCKFYVNTDRNILRVRDNGGKVLNESTRGVFQRSNVYHQNSKKKFSNMKTLIGKQAVVK